MFKTISKISLFTITLFSLVATAPIIAHAAGESCTHSEQCGFGEDCFDGICTAECGPLGVTCDEGADCCGAAECVDSKAGGQRCQIPENGPCTTDSECQADTYCFAGTCQYGTPDGGACTWSEECFFGSDCFNGICTSECGPLGVTCDESGDCCGVTQCLDSKAGGQRCQIPWGESCTSDAQCELGTDCVNGVCSDLCAPAWGDCNNSSECCGSAYCFLGTCWPMEEG